MLYKLIVRYNRNINVMCLRSIKWKSHNIRHIVSNFTSNRIDNRRSQCNYRLQNFTYSTKENRIVSDVCKEWTLRFEDSGIPEPETSIKLITEHVLRSYSEQVGTFFTVIRFS